MERSSIAAFRFNGPGLARRRHPADADTLVDFSPAAHGSRRQAQNQAGLIAGHARSHRRLLVSRPYRRSDRRVGMATLLHKELNHGGTENAKAEQMFEPKNRS